MKTNLTAEQIAQEFLCHLNASLTPEEAREVVKRNQEDAIPFVCHSHDFSDANQLLLNALESLGLDVTGDDFDFNDYSFCILTNEAWHIAKSRFSEDLHGSIWGRYNILAPLKRLAADYPNLKPEVMGGNCDYVIMDFENGAQLVLTGKEDPEINNVEDPCSVCLFFDSKSQEGIEFSFPSAIAALAFMDSLKPL